MYRCIVIDPPWPEQGGGKSVRGAQRHYALLKPHQIVETILTSSHWKPDDEGCHLWMWVTDNYLLDGLDIMRSLGFRYIRTLSWTKLAEPRVNKVLDIFGGDLPLEDAISALKAEFRRVQIGLGQYLRGSHELCLLGVRGRLKAERAVSSALLEERTKHSRKPQGAYEAIESVSSGPRLEMFARGPRDGWDVWGLEADGSQPK